jgi:hypothetical protein
MNTLTWFLYLADVGYKQIGLLWVVFILVPVLYLLGRTITKMWAADIYSWDPKELNDKKRAEKVRPFITTYKPFVFSLVGMFLLNLAPSQDTFYLMAASEAGEMVVKTPEAQEIMSDLKQILDAQLEKLKGQ